MWWYDRGATFWGTQVVFLEIKYETITVTIAANDAIRMHPNMFTL